MVFYGLAPIVLAMLSVKAPKTSAPGTDPYRIFARAQTYWEQQTYPAYLQYDVAVTVEEGGSARTERYQSDDDLVNHQIRVDGVSDWQRTHPPSGRGVNVSLFFVPLSKPEPPVDFLGVPVLAPTYSFGMAGPAQSAASRARDPKELVAEIRREFHDPNPRAAPANDQQAGAATGKSGALPEIAHVFARDRNYDIVLAGIESVDTHSCFHLELTPLRDPGRYRLRELWIDRSTFATWKLREALNFVRGPGTSVPWTVRFADENGAHYIAGESADAPMSYGGEIYTAAHVRFENIRSTPQKQRVFYANPGGLILQEPL